VAPVAGVPASRAGLRSLAIPFPDGPGTRAVATLKKLEAGAEVELAVSRDAGTRPLLAAVTVLLGIAALLAARHWRARRAEPTLSSSA
jgi:hypothetical protein